MLFQLEVYYEVDRLLNGITAQQKGTTARRYSNKTSLCRVIFMEDLIRLRTDRSILIGKQSSKWSLLNVVFHENKTILFEFCIYSQ